ncbi:MAG TPA: hypothetical protein VEF89_16165 [Solirubrobacteraceae bacterium]|nr:hypothetical protein [Solirubrobacteraceae bacterium]
MGARKAGLEDRLIARMLAPWLDRELAAGMRPSLSEAHAARAEQLAGERVRSAVARSLEKLLARAQRPTPAAPKATIPLCREQVLAAAPLIASTASRLRSREPMDPCAVARLKILAGDRRGPCYVRSRPDALMVALREISEPPRPA